MVVDHQKPLPSVFIDKFQKLIVLLFEINDSCRNDTKYKVNKTCNFLKSFSFLPTTYFSYVHFSF